MENLRDIANRLDLTLESAGFGLWDLDPVSQTVHYSPRWRALLGYEEHDERESTSLWRSRVHPDDLPAMMAALLAHLEGRSTSYEHEFRLRAADGLYRFVLSRGRVVARNESGVAVRMVGTLIDMTSRHQADYLRSEIDRAAAAGYDGLEVLAHLNHDLRTPLNAVLGFAQLLREELDTTVNARQQEYLAGIERAGWQLLERVERVLQLCERNRPVPPADPAPSAASASDG